MRIGFGAAMPQETAKVVAVKMYRVRLIDGDDALPTSNNGHPH